MNKTTIALGITALVLGAAIIAPQAIFAYRGDASVKGPNHSVAREEAIEDANLSEFKATCVAGRMCEIVDTQEELNVLKQMHESNEKGDTATAAQLRTKLGLGMRNGSGMGQGMGRGRNK